MLIARPIGKLLSDLPGILNSGQERSVSAKKNIAKSFLIKVISIGISFLIVPITISYINTSQYGIWLTLTSIVGWFSFFDIGLTHGLRNMFARAKANGDHQSAQAYVSTTYAILGIVFSTVWLIFLLVNQFLSWPDVLNVQAGMQAEISMLAVIVFTYFCLQFILKIISTVVIANQEPAKASLIDLAGQITSFVIILILVNTTQGSLIYLGLALCVSPILASIAANYFLFKGEYKPYRPSFSKIRFSNAKGLLNLGWTFFIIQISVVIQLETANIIIARNFGTTEVTSYNIVYKYFNIITMFFIIFLTPFWSAATEAFLKKDLPWIKNGIRKYNYLNILLFVVSVIMLIFSNAFYSLWLGKNIVSIDFWLSFWGCVFVNLYIFGSKYVFFLNGISALKLQFWVSLVSPLVYIATAFILIDYFKMGVYSLFIASVVANLNGILIAPLQYYQIVHRNKTGIWIR